MKWAYRLAIAGIVWAILVFVFANPTPEACRLDDFCAIGIYLLNPPFFLVALTAGLLSPVVLPFSGIGGLAITVACDGLTGFLIGLVIGRRPLQGYRLRGIRPDKSE
jgi:hypothetical protein